MRMRGWRLGIAISSLLPLTLICALRGDSGARPQEAKGTEARHEQPSGSVEGSQVFRAHCAACHGNDGKGNGPVAPFLKATMPDLTVIAKQNGGNFPVASVRRIIIGGGIITSHGSREMPVWGPVFNDTESDADKGNLSLENLLKYLESIQIAQSSEEKPANRLPAPTVPSGEKLYKQNCAACHGNDLKGNGPAPPPFMDVPPDLTTLSRRHGGKFPDEYVAEVLRNGVVIPAHGPPEMPAWGMDFRTRDQLDSIQVTLRIINLSNYLKSLQAK